MLVEGRLGKLSAGVDNMLGVEDLRFFSETDDPAQENGRNGHVHQEGEMVFSVGDQHQLVTEAVNNHIGQAAVEPELDGGRVAGIHLE